MKFGDFRNISKFPELSLKSFGNSLGNSYIPCLQVIIAHRLTCGETTIWYNIKMSQNVMKVIFPKVRFAFCVFINN